MFAKIILLLQPSTQFSAMCKAVFYGIIWKCRDLISAQEKTLFYRLVTNLSISSCHKSTKMRLFIGINNLKQPAARITSFDNQLATSLHVDNFGQTCQVCELILFVKSRERILIYRLLYNNACSFCIFIGRELCVIQVHTHG